MTVWTETPVKADTWKSGGYLFMPGTENNYAFTPDSSALSIIGDIDIRCDLLLDDWSGLISTDFINKGTSGSISYILNMESTGKFQLVWGVDIAISTTPNGFVNGSRHWIRVTLDVDNGNGGYDVKFYTSTDGLAWTQLGDTVTGTPIASIIDNTSQIEFGSFNNRPAGKIYRAQIYDGINGTLAFDVNFEGTTSRDGATSIVESSPNAAEVTVVQAGSNPAVIVVPTLAGL